MTTVIYQPCRFLIKGMRDGLEGVNRVNEAGAVTISDLRDYQKGFEAAQKGYRYQYRGKVYLTGKELALEGVEVAG